MNFPVTIAVFDTPLWRCIRRGRPARILAQMETPWAFVRGRSGHHMGVFHGERCIEAWWPRVRNARIGETLAGETHARVREFAIPDLSQDEYERGIDTLFAMVGRPYDLLQLGVRSVKALARILSVVGGPNIPAIVPDDILGDVALICYELVGLFMNATGRFDVDPDTFGPPDVWALADRGRLQLVNTIADVPPLTE